MKKIVFLLASSLMLWSTELIINGQHTQSLGNPFKAKLSLKDKQMQIIDSSFEHINANIKTNISDFNLYTQYQKPSFTIDPNSCNVILKKYLSEDYKINNSQSNNTASCKILASDIYIDYYDEDKSSNLIHNITVTTKIKLTIKKDNQIIIDRIIEDKMDKTLGIKGNNYDWSITTNMKLSTNDIKRTVEKITEYSIYKMINKELGGLK